MEGQEGQEGQVIEMDSKTFEQIIDERVQKTVGELGLEDKMRESVEGLKKDHAEWQKKSESEKLRAERAQMRQLLFSSGQSFREKSKGAFTGIRGALFIALAQRAQIDNVPLKSMADMAEKAGYPEVARALSVSVSASGGILIPEEFADDFIGAVYSRVVVRQLGARIVPMPQGGKLAIGKLTQSATFYWVDENANGTVSEQQFGKESLEVYKGMILVPISNDFLRRGPSGIEQIITDDITNVAAVGVDAAFIRGDGVGKPSGIDTQMEATHKKAITGATLADVENDLLDMQYLVHSNLPAGQAVSPGWMMNMRTKFGLMKVRTADGYPIYQQELRAGMLFNAPVADTASIPVNLGAGSNEGSMYYGDFNEALIGDTLRPQIDTSNTASYDVGGTQYNTFQNDQSLIRLIVEVDLLLRRKKAFAKRTGVTY